MLRVGLGYIHADSPLHIGDGWGVRRFDDHPRADDTVDVVRDDNDRLTVQREPTIRVLPFTTRLAIDVAVVRRVLFRRVGVISGILRRCGLLTVSLSGLISRWISCGIRFIGDRRARAGDSQHSHDEEREGTTRCSATNDRVDVKHACHPPRRPTSMMVPGEVITAGLRIPCEGEARMAIFDVEPRIKARQPRVSVGGRQTDDLLAILANEAVGQERSRLRLHPVAVVEPGCDALPPVGSRVPDLVRHEADVAALRGVDPQAIAAGPRPSRQRARPGPNIRYLAHCGAGPARHQPLISRPREVCAISGALLGPFSGGCWGLCVPCAGGR